MDRNGFQVIMTLLGSLAVFIYGMNLMSDGLQKAAGDKMRKFLSLLTRNPLTGVLAGILTAAVLQSSSATTVMVIGFVSAGLMNLPQAVSIILGANIGTTITAQLIAFQVGDYFWIFILIGFTMHIFMKKENWVHIGQTIFAFGLLFLSIYIMSESMKRIALLPETTQLFLTVKEWPVIGVFLGTAMSLVLQSSTASMAVLQNLAEQIGANGFSSVIGLEAALPIIFGTNIGTTITAVAASVGAPSDAKRTAAAHILFNVVGTFLFMFFIPAYCWFIRYISPSGLEYQVIARQIANAHTFFNVINTLIFLPFIGVLVKLVIKIIPDKDADRLPWQPQYLDYNIIDQPVFAIHLATKELLRMAEFAFQMIKNAKKGFIAGDAEAVRNVAREEEIVNRLQEEAVKYLASIFATDTLTEHQGNIVSGLIHISSDIEHMGDNCVNIAAFAEEKMKNGYEFSDAACAEIYECFDQATRMARTMMRVLEERDIHLAKELLAQKKEMNRMEERLKKQHIRRLYDKSCSPEFTVMYTDVIHNIERIGDSCKKIAEAVISDIQFKENNMANKEFKDAI